MALLSRLLRLLQTEVSTRIHAWERRVGGQQRVAEEEAWQEPGWSGPRPDPTSGTSAGAAGSQDPTLAGYYANLELPYGADLDAVHSAWKRLVRKYHPDLHSANEGTKRIATELVQGLNHAHRELTKHLKGRGA